MINLSWSCLMKEIEKANLLDDKVEKNNRLQLLDNIIDKVNEYNEHISCYDYAQKRLELINKGVSFILEPRPSTIKESWNRLFAASVSSDVLNQIGYDTFKWHIFSFELVNALTKSRARQAFNRCRKEKVYIFYQRNEEVFYIENPQFLKARDFDLDSDIYIFDVTNKWTYVHTHESQCGPYFYKL